MKIGAAVKQHRDLTVCSFPFGTVRRRSILLTRHNRNRLQSAYKYGKQSYGNQNRKNAYDYVNFRYDPNNGCNDRKNGYCNGSIRGNQTIITRRSAFGSTARKSLRVGRRLLFCRITKHAFPSRIKKDESLYHAKPGLSIGFI